MITIQTLENTDTNTILNTFNLAFSDYVVPMRITEEQLINKMKTENIRLDYSVGAFNQNELIAFILHGQNTINGKSIVYNGGTGVIPTQRGQKLTAQLYEFILPKLRAEQIDSVLLEVITTNLPAVTTYEKIGFKTLRTLDCFKGNILQQPVNPAYEIKELKNWDWNLLCSFWDWNPTNQNGISAIEINKSYLISLGIYKGEELCGYLIYNPKSNRIQQFAVAKAHRNKGLASQLFSHIAQQHTSEVAMINIDHSSAETLAFLQKTGFEKTISQYEMELKL